MKVLLLGSGALQIGQAGEFDYSGSQAIKALKEEKAKVILVNPNIATIQTSENFADEVYFLPVNAQFVEKIIEKEKPDALLLSFGGQTALNCGLALEKLGILKKHKVKVLGTPITAIQKTEDRKLFVDSLAEIDALTPKSIAVGSTEDAKKAAKKLTYPVMIRGGFSLGGQDSGVAHNESELSEIAQKALAKVSQILIEEYLAGWKEIEYEVVRDKYDNCITVCNMENVDPMGIHTGESIVVAPSQTLNNYEYQKLREIALKVIRHLGIVGECNIQFALNPSPAPRSNPSNLPLQNPRSHVQPPTSTLDYRIIEVNARLSRSSALASKATGYPLAYVAAKLALGFDLTQIKNSVTKKTTACFEPALDYLVIKIPRWDLSKFVKSEQVIGSSMQSVGEVMAIGRKFEEALQKATRMLDIGMEGPLDEKAKNINYKKPTPWRLFSIARSIKAGESTNKISKETGIDLFFLEKIKNIAIIEKQIETQKTLSEDLLKSAKQHGFSDRRIAKLTKTDTKKIESLRNTFGIQPVVKQIDTLAAEYPAETNYLYLTYNGETDDISRLEPLTSSPKIIILGSGPYRIGSSVEFDWCSVTCAKYTKENGFLPIIINCNPETVSTDYDMAERLYFEELTEETIAQIYKIEKPLGIIVSMGGQTPNNLTPQLAKRNMNILGTTPQAIDMAEDRNKFSALCDTLKINQPPWANLQTPQRAVKFAKKIGYPVLVRPSYVLSGASMNVAFNSSDLQDYLVEASDVSSEHPVVISKFLQDAKEFEIDAVAASGKVLCSAILEHIENAGVHSGDSTIVLPPQKLYLQTAQLVENIARKIAFFLKITGPFNIQFLARDNNVLVIECNLRASRSLPFVSKVTGINFAKVATVAILGLRTTNYELRTMNYVAVKAPQFSFSRIKGADPVLRVEMASTGEVATFGDDLPEAFLKSLIATGTSLPKKAVFISLAGDQNKAEFLESVFILQNLGLKIYATAGTSTFLNKHNIPANRLFKIHENKHPNVLNILNEKKVDLVINIIDPYFKKEFDDDYQIRRTTIDFGIPLLTNMQTAELFVKSISQKTLKDLKVLPWSYYQKANKFS